MPVEGCRAAVKPEKFWRIVPELAADHRPGHSQGPKQLELQPGSSRLLLPLTSGAAHGNGPAFCNAILKA